MVELTRSCTYTTAQLSVITTNYKVRIDWRTQENVSKLDVEVVVVVFTSVKP